MSNEFPNTNDELKRVAEEITLLRRDLQSTSAILGRIERRLKASFVNYPEKPKKQKNTNKVAAQSIKTDGDLQTLFKELVLQTKQGGESAFVSRIDELKSQDIIALAVEVGIGSPSKLSRNKAVEGLRKRVQEALQLQYR